MADDSDFEGIIKLQACFTVIYKTQDWSYRSSHCIEP